MRHVCEWLAVGRFLSRFEAVSAGGEAPSVPRRSANAGVWIGALSPGLAWSVPAVGKEVFLGITKPKARTRMLMQRRARQRFVMCARRGPCMLPFRRAQGGGRLRHVELSWSVGDILSAGPYSGKQKLLSLAAGRPRPIRTEQHHGGHHHRLCWATLSGYWIGDAHGHQLHHSPCCLLGTTGAWHDWCRGVHRPSVVQHAGEGGGAELEMVLMEQESEYRACLSSTCKVGRAGPSELHWTS